MNRLVLRNLLVLAVLLGLAPLIAHGAAAQNAVPALRANVTVAGDVVRIGDLIEHAGPVADIPIFRSPDLGTRGAVATDAILDAVRPHQLIEIDTRGLAEVIVTRASRAITVPEIVARIAQALSEEYGMGEARNITVNFDREARPIHIEASATGELQVTALSYDPRNARFDVTFDLPSSAVLHRRPARLSGTAIETVAAVTVEHPVEHGEVLKASDLTVLRRPKAEGGNITDVNAVLGLAARRPLRPGQPIHDAESDEAGTGPAQRHRDHRLRSAGAGADAARPGAGRRRARRRGQRAQRPVEARGAGRRQRSRSRDHQGHDHAPCIRTGETRVGDVA